MSAYEFNHVSEKFPLKNDIGGDICIRVNGTKAVIKSQKNGDVYEGSFQVKGNKSKSVMEMIELAKLLLSNFMVQPDYQYFIDQENKSIDAAIATLTKCQQEQDQQKK